MPTCTSSFLLFREQVSGLQIIKYFSIKHKLHFFRIFEYMSLHGPLPSSLHSKKSLSYFKKKKTYFKRNILKKRENFLGEW